MTETLLGQDPATLLREPSTAWNILHNAYALATLIAEEADATEDRGHLSEPILAALRKSGLFQMGFPASRGGLEMSLRDQVEAVAAVARADAGIGWNVGVLNATGIYAGRLGEDAYAELYPDFDRPTSGSFHPRGRADKVEGGYLVSGQWQWASGSYSADYIIGGALVFENGEPVLKENGKQLLLGLWLPRDAIEVAHDWQVLGVVGSGSTSFSIPTAAFVPEDRCFDREPDRNAHADPLNKSVHVAFFGLTGLVLGIAQHAVDLAVSAVRSRIGAGGASAIDSATRLTLAEAIAEVDFAFGGVFQIAEQTDRVLFEAGEGLTPQQEARMFSANMVAAKALQRVLPMCTELIGAAHIFDTHPMQRVVRDAQTALAHAGARRANLQILSTVVLDNVEFGTTFMDDIRSARMSRGSA